jgi:Notch-like protein
MYLSTLSLQPRFGGLNCENNKSPFNVNPFLHGGSCNEHNITSFNCTCPAGFEGLTCDINIDDCVSSPCPLHSNCIDKVNGYSCKCHQSQTGKNCETGKVAIQR